MNRYPLPLLGFVAYSGSGKTTLLEKLIPLLRKRGLRVALLKHAHHDFDIDKPGKDSHRLRKAGAAEVLIASRRRWALIHENSNQLPEPELFALLGHLDTAHLDLVLVEGFKHERYPKVELQRAELEKPLLYPHDPHIIAIACDQAMHERLEATPPTLLDINDIPAIADYVVGNLDRLQTVTEPKP